MPDLITCALVYLAIGSLLWLFLDASGVIGRSYAERVSRGKEPSLAAMLLASLGVIVAWPAFVVKWAKSARAGR